MKSGFYNNFTGQGACTVNGVLLLQLVCRGRFTQGQHSVNIGLEIPINKPPVDGIATLPLFFS